MASSGPSSGVSRSSYTRTVKLYRAGTLSDDGVEVSIDQITPRTVSSLFNVCIYYIFGARGRYKLVYIV